MRSLAGLSLAVASRDSSVTTVINLLQGLKTKVQKDLENEAAMMEEYTAWCDDQKTTLSYDIKDDNRIIAESQAAIEGAQGKLEGAETRIGELGPAIAGKNKEMAEAKKVREDENAAFVAKEKELNEALDMLRRAYKVLKQSLTSNLSLAQTSKTSINEVISALGTIVASSWVAPEKADKLKSFLEMDDELTLRAPQAMTSSYESKSGGILTTIEGMQDDTEQSLREATRAETKARHSYEMLMQSLKNEVETMGDQLAQAQAAKGAAGDALGAAKGTLSKTSDSLAADEALLSQVTQSCAAKAEEWATRQNEAAAEMDTLQKASDILGKGVVVLAQTSMRTRRVAGAEMDRREAAVSILRKLGHKYNSFGLLQAASSASADPFGKVTGLIRDMLAKLQEQAAAEKSHHEMCQEETAKNTAYKNKKVGELEKHQTRLDKAVASIARLRDEVSSLETELADLAKAVAEAKSMRANEKSANEKVIADNQGSAAAVAEAIKTLREYYDEPALVQTQQPTVGFAKAQDTTSIIAILQTAQSEFEQLVLQTQTDEESSSAAHEKFLQEAEVTKAKKEATVAGKKTEIETNGVSKNQFAEDIETTSKELDSVQKTLDTLAKQCANKAMSYEERKERREAEIAGLKEALEILGGGDGALLQTRSFLARH